MASAGYSGDIVGEAAEATKPTRNGRTIYDYLGQGDDSEEASPPSPETPPPRLRLPMFTCARIRFCRLGRKRGGRGGRKKAAAAENSEDASVDSSGWKQTAAGTSGGGGGSVSAGGQSGMGLSMLFLLARTCVELNRMAEVRAQMETLLNEVRDEAGRVKGGAAADHVVIVTPKACNNRQSSSSTTTTTNTASSSSCVSDDTSTTTNCLEIRRGEDDGEPPSSETESAARRDQLPDCRCDTEQDTPDHQCWVQSSSSTDDDGEFIELEGGRFGTGEEKSHSQRGSAVVVVDESDDGESCERRHEGGVSATELERRLHELQHRRDRERIEALESALRRAQRKLTEKEMEARLWQDTATMALGQPVPRPAGRTGSHQ